ncbi:MAG: VOC family protein [Pseudomonadota bacterium]
MNAPPAPNRHPGVMFEIMARDQHAMQAFYTAVFGWHYMAGEAGFAYVRFPVRMQPLLGGIGQADASVPGMAPGHAFYLEVDELDATMARAVAAGGSRLMEPTDADGYRFAMIRDPEGNAVGLVRPFR